jgi:CheY-like chemotaxis protein
LPNNLKHDLRTPLNHIIGYCELLLEESAKESPPQLLADLEHIHLAGRRLLFVINDLFDPIKSAAYKADPALVHHEIRTPLNQIIGYAEMLQEEAQEQGAGAFAEDAGKILEAAHKLLHLMMENFGESKSGLDLMEEPVGAHSTTFLRHDDAVPTSSVRIAAQPVSGGQSGSILIVDDDEGNRAMLSRRLVRLGFQTTVAENGRSALEKLKSARFDLMLLDIQMPELNGYEVLERLKANPALRDIPVIVLSASDEIERVARCIEMGAEDYLPKPFDPVLLQARIGASLEKKRLRDREVSHLRQIQEEKKRSDDLLHIILPHDVAQELKTTQAVRPRRFENVGVLFCDIVSFTAWCDKHAPNEILTYLQSLVEAFEGISLDCGLEKIKTIGDSFMATAGLLAPATNPALDCVRCGLAMIAKAKELPPHWQVRVGVHAGPVMAGVVGRRKYQYDIWGDTVNTAARMEQASLPGSIAVTADTWQLLAAHCTGVRQGNVEIKGKGTLDLYRIDQLNLGS